MNDATSHHFRHAVLAVTLCALPATAGPDTYGLGTGKDGARAVNTSGAILNTYAQLSAPAAPGDTSLLVGSTTGFSANDLVLVIQMTGIVPEPPSGGPSPVDLTNDSVGRWEPARLTAVTATTVTLDVPLVHSYAALVTQLVRVPEYTAVTINPPGSITSSPWNGSTGGVVAFLANGTVTNNSFPGINVTGRGFRGGVSVNDASGSTGCTGLDEPAATGAQRGEGVAVTRFGTSQTGRGRVANGGGGGVCLRAGGGGGSNGGVGGQGGSTDFTLDGNRAVGGQAGAALTFDLLNHLVMGGGGGAGHGSGGAPTAGGAGGGIIFVRAAALSGAGSFAANGATGGSTTAQDGASGGGGGGTISLRIAGAAICGTVQALGGTGGNASGGTRVGPGGGGGGGRILLQKGSGTCTLSASLIVGANAGVQQDAAAPGGASYGALAGSSGASTTLTGGFPASLPTPALTTPANSSRTNDNTPLVTGTTSGTLQVAVFIDGVEVGRATPDGSGNWSLSPASALTDGTHTVRAVTVDTVNAVQSLSSTTNSFIVDTLAPTVAGVTTPPAGATLAVSTPSYAGTAEANSTVTVQVDSVTVGTTTATASGTWTFTQPAALAEGAHTVRASATDAAGNASAFSATRSFTVDTVAPAAPAVSTPASGATVTATPTFAGSAEANSTVTVQVDNVTAGTTTASASGTWTFTQPTALTGGAHAMRAFATDAAGNVGPFSAARSFTTDPLAPAAPVITSPASGAAVTATPTYAGTAEPGSTVTVQVDGVTVGMTTTPAGGSWSFTQPTSLVDGPHLVKANATDAAGNASAFSTDRPFTVDTVAPAAPVVSTPTSGAAVTATPTYAGTAEANSTVTVQVDSVTAGTTTASASGAWTFTQPTALAVGSHDVRATATDAAGNVSPFSAVRSFTVSPATLAAPVVTAPVEGSVTSDDTPTLLGTAEPGSTVNVSLNGAAVGTSPADANGNWQLLISAPLADGAYVITSVATRGVSTSPASNAVSFSVDTTAPDTTFLSAPAAETNSTSAAFQLGSNEPGVSFECSLDRASFSPCASAVTLGSLAPGSHTLEVRARDAAGNLDPTPASFTWTVKRLAPVDPELRPAVGCASTGADLSTLPLLSLVLGVLSRRRLQRRLPPLTGAARALHSSR